MEGSGAESGPVQILTDPDPRGPKPLESRSRTLLFTPDPDTATQINTTDPDPEHWQRIQVWLHAATFLFILSFFLHYIWLRMDIRYMMKLVSDDL